MPQAPSPPTTQENPSPHRSSPHSTAPPRTATGFETCHGNGRSTTAHSDGTKSHRGSRPSACTRSTSPPPPGHLTGRHHLLLTVKGDATITRREGDPVTAAPAHALHIPPQASLAPMAVHQGPTPWQAIVITYPTSNNHTHTWQQRWEDIRGDLLQEHLGLTRTPHTLHPIRGVDQAPHGIHTPGLWGYATP